MNPDYSKAASGYQISAVTKGVDAFYGYAALDNAEMLAGVKGEYLAHATKTATLIQPFPVSATTT